jgi:hypothetical protein
MSGKTMDPDPHRTSRQASVFIIGLTLAGLLLHCEILPARDSSPSTTGAPNLQTLFSRLAQRKETRVRFVETKTLSVLSQPLKQQGTLEFQPPGMLAKHVDKPQEEHYVIEGSHVTISKAGESSEVQLNLSDYPALEAFAEGLRAPLAGDLETLHRYWKPSLGGSWRRWLLILTPLSPELATLIRSVRLEGQDDRLIRMTLEETGGDHSTLDFMPVP